jgi:hypothetical protein
MGFDFAVVVWPQYFATLIMHTIKNKNKNMLSCKSMFGIMVGTAGSP